MENSGWCCNLCGYLYRGDAPPDCCPVCGATPDLFAPSTTAPSVHGAVHRWRCINCDYLHDGDAPPERCPLCGVGPDQFEPVEEPRPRSSGEGMTGMIVIVGGGIAGLSAAEAARKAAPEAAIALICKEEDLPYYRLNLTRYLAGEVTADELPVHQASWYAAQRITVLGGVEVTAIDRTARTISSKGQPTLYYDKLVLAAGAHPLVPPIPGATRENVVTLRTRRDADFILRLSHEGARCVVVGGGVLGLETAAALARRKVRVTLVEGFDWLLPRQLNRVAAGRIADQALALGITLVLAARVKELAGDDCVRGVVLESGEVLPADLVVITAGVRSNSYLARLAGLEVNDGVVVDQHLATSDPDIFAAGDLAEHQGTVYGTWGPSRFQGVIAGMNAAGEAVVFAGIPRANSIKVLGAELFSIGMVHPDDASYRIFSDDADHYHQFIFRDATLVGAVLVGDTSLAPALKRLIEAGTSCADLLAGASGPGDIRAAIAAMG